jgi:1-acyl-sn-glycerol-3-phosphate acyltransferase
MKRIFSGGLPRPPGYESPPSPHPGDVLRTLHSVFADVVPSIARLAASPDLKSTTSMEGLAFIRSKYEKMLVRLGIDLQVHQADRVPPEGGFLFFYNQESHLDHVVLPCAIPRPFISLYNNAVARIPYYAAHMKRTGHVHVDRTNETQWRKGVARAAEQARNGVCVLLSPEGTRSWDGKLLPLKRGGFIMAAESERPIICVTVVGGHERMPRGSPIVRQGPMHVAFSDPIETRGESEAHLMDAVATTFRETKARYVGSSR